MPDAHAAHVEPAHDLNDALASVKRQQNVSAPRHALELASVPDNPLQITTIDSPKMVRCWFTAFHPPCSFLRDLSSASHPSISIHIKT
jgi:hypothetical protein